MGAALNAAQAINAYTVSDRGTWLSFANKAISLGYRKRPPNSSIAMTSCRDHGRVLSEPCSVFHWDRGFEAGLLQRRVHEPIGFCRRFHFALRRRKVLRKLCQGNRIEMRASSSYSFHKLRRGHWNEKTEVRVRITRPTTNPAMIQISVSFCSGVSSAQMSRMLTGGYSGGA